MPRTLRALIPVAALLSALLAAPTDASALTTLTNYFGNAPTNIRIVNIHPWGQYVIMERQSDGACAFYKVGDANGLDDNYVFNGGTGADWITFYVNAPAMCGYNYGWLLHNGHYFDVHGGGGDDSVRAIHGDTYIYGDDGNDYLSISSHSGAIGRGGNGNDDVYGNNSSNSDRLYGDAGNDALCDAAYSSSGAALMDGGSGTDCRLGTATTITSVESTSCSSRCYYLY